jgi:hypothetical protein
VGSDSSTSYGVKFAVPRVGENNAGKSAIMELELMPLGQTSDAVAIFDASSHKFCRYGSTSTSKFGKENVPKQLGANPKLNFLEATSTTILVRSKKFNPRMAGKDPPPSTLNSWFHENESNFT